MRKHSRFKLITKYTLVFIMSSLFVFVCSIAIAFLIPSKIKFDLNKIKYSNATINVYDKNNCIIKDNTTNSMTIRIDTLNKYTQDAFISIEDKNFYSHHGLNYKRMIGAMLKNIKSLKLKEGASTISQQLIKNTHLTNEKTFARKINEIKLTRTLEKKLSKKQILEYYLNIIYFGDNCYGLENASMHYFSKSAKELDLSESATLAGMIKSPNYYSPTTNIQRSTSRRNVVLKEMLDDNKISFKQYNDAKNVPLNVCVYNSNENNLNTYKSACIDEASSILNMPQKQIAIGEFKIYSFYDKFKQEKLVESINNYDCSSDKLAISISAKDGKIEAYYGKSNIKMLNVKRQPGSAIKPILVYAPAINENIISPLTQINDEYININGYSPTNINNKFHGYISARESLSKSLNIPAVKILSYVGIDKAKNYAEMCNFDFDQNDNNLGLALGGMTYGVSLKTLTGAYGIFANSGVYHSPHFINYITDKNDKIIYHYQEAPKQVIREDTAFLMTDMLKTCAKTGTGKKLGNLNFDVATKTGTVGKNGNTDAYNISFTSEDIVGVWFGNADNTKISIAGSGLPTDVVKCYLSNINIQKPLDFYMPSSVCEEKVDQLSLDNEHVIYKANSYIPEKYIITELFSKFNLPKEKSTKFISVEAPVLQGKIQNDRAELSFEANDYLIYEIYKTDGINDILLSTVTNKKGLCTQTFDISQITSYFVITKIKNYSNNIEIISDKSNIVQLVPTSKTTGYSRYDEKWFY